MRQVTARPKSQSVDSRSRQRQIGTRAFMKTPAPLRLFWAMMGRPPVR